MTHQIDLSPCESAREKRHTLLVFMYIWNLIKTYHQERRGGNKKRAENYLEGIQSTGLDPKIAKMLELP